MRAVAFSLDDAYLMPFKVLWYSLIKSESIPTYTRIFILHEDTLTGPSIDELSSYISKDGFNVTFVNASSRMPDNLPIKLSDHVSKATFYRLYIASILPQEISSVIYLDSDAIVIRSIRQLFEIELTHPIAAVDHLSPQNAIRLWGDLSGNYFQAGVLIIDLVVWRSLQYESVFAKILAEYQNKIKWWDQCVLNLAFKDNWQRLPIWFNVCSSVRHVLDTKRLNNESRFLHFDGSSKPWKILLKSPHSMRWYITYEKTFGVTFNFKFIKQPFWQKIKNKIKYIIKIIIE